MSYAAAVNAFDTVKPMSIFKGVSNKQLAQILSDADTAAAKALGNELESTFLAIARGQPYDLPKPPQNPPTSGVISGFFAKLGL